MKVFISWSGRSSQAVAELLADTIPVILQTVKPFISVDDLRKGGRWQADLSGALQSTNVGIICLTRSNLEAPWIMFEAGALSKSVDDSCVMPLLIGLNPSDIRPPLSQFNVTKFDKVDFFRLINTINGLSGENALPEKVLLRAFEQAWPELEEGVAKIAAEEKRSSENSGIAKEDPADVILKSIDEILTIVRSTSSLQKFVTSNQGYTYGNVPLIHPSTHRVVFEESGPPLSISGRVILDIEKRRRAVLTLLYRLEGLTRVVIDPAISHKIAALSRELNKVILPIFRQLLGTSDAELSIKPSELFMEDGSDQTGVDPFSKDE